MIKNYIFDFGNVITRFDPMHMTTHFVDDQEIAAAICDVAFDRYYWDKLDSGSITDEQVKGDFYNRLPREHADIACKIYDTWVELRSPIEGMPELILDIKSRGNKIYLLSNISIGFTQKYHRNPWISNLFSQFDGLVFSGPLGIVKPSREIYEHLLGRYNLSADECLFIDDSPQNIAAAQAMGIHGYLFDGDVQRLRDTLIKEG